MIKKIMLLVILLVMVTPVYAAEPTEETACCLLFENGFTLSEACDQYEINKERCDVINSKYRRARDSGLYAPIVILLAAIALTSFAIWLIFKRMKR